MAFHAPGERQVKLAPVSCPGALLERGWRSDFAICNKDLLWVQCDDNCKLIPASHYCWERVGLFSGRNEIEIGSPCSSLVSERCATKAIPGFRVIIKRNYPLTLSCPCGVVDSKIWKLVSVIYNIFSLQVK